MSLVVLEEVTLFFADRMIFDAASLRIGSHDRIGLVGPNGSGKTTLLKVIAGLQEIDDGKAVKSRIEGTTVTLSAKAGNLSLIHISEPTRPY